MHIQSHFSVDHRHHEQRVWMTFRKPVAMRLVVQGLELRLRRMIEALGWTGPSRRSAIDFG